jgi:hypothetical protein
MDALAKDKDSVRNVTASGAILMVLSVPIEAVERLAPFCAQELGAEVCP